MATRRCGRVEAEAVLAERAGRPDALARFTERVATAQLANDTARRWFADRFAESVPARDLWESRGFSLEVATIGQIGYAPPDPAAFLHAMRDARITNAALLDAGLLYLSSRGSLLPRFRNRLLFPITDDTDLHCIAFGGRVIDNSLPQAPKYLNSATSLLWTKGQTLYGLGRAAAAVTETRCGVLTEGYFSTLRCWEAGMSNTVASCGTAVTRAQLAKLREVASAGKERRTIGLTVAYDEGADEAAVAAARLAVADGFAVRIVEFPPEGDDPDTYGRVHGLPALRTLLDRAPNALQRLYTLRAGLTGADPLYANLPQLGLAARVRVFPELVEFAGSATRTRVRSQMVTQIADWFSLPAETLSQYLHTISRSERPRAASR